MARSYHVFGNIEGKLDVLHVECTKCDRKGRCSVAKLIAKHGRKANVSAWASDLKATARSAGADERTRCDPICPDLSKVL